MKLLNIIFLVLVMTVSVAWAQSNIVTETKINGRVVNVEKSPMPIPDAFNPFEETDSDRDGRVNKQEARNAGILEFSAADTNGDGFLDSTEYYNAANGPANPSGQPVQ